MKIVGINSLGYGSPANIMNNILITTKKEIGADVYSFYGAWGKKSKYDISERYGFTFENLIAKYLSKITGYQHIWCILNTQILIHKLKKINPDIIHLHNLHLWDINVPLLFKYIKENKVKVVWTLHDCWSFTGQCPYFSEIGCNKWKYGCNHCKQLKRYPSTYIDNTKKMYQLKKEWFLGVDNLILVTPSNWLKGLVEESFLKQYPVYCINNGIDTNIFFPRKSNFKNKYNLKDKHIILGVSLEWGHRKGLDIFIKLSKILSDEYKIVLIGVDEKLKKELPSNIISIARTHDQIELAEIYSSADIFLNPTREDNYPTVNIEALACGTPVITSRNGGSPEMILDQCGFACDIDDIDEIVFFINKILNNAGSMRESCVIAAQNFKDTKKFEEYINLYECLMKGYY